MAKWIHKNKKDKTISDSQNLRDRSWAIINKIHLDYMPKFIGPKPDSKPEDDTQNGIIRTPMGYYRLAEDPKTQNRVLLHSFERNQLKGKMDENGDVWLLEDDDDVYGITAHKDVRGAIFRDDMKRDIRYLEQSMQQDLNLHFENLSQPLSQTDSEEKNAQKHVQLSNRLVSFEIKETDDQKYEIYLFKNLRHEWDKTKQFVNSSPSITNGLLGLQVKIKETDNYEDALQYVRRLWNTESTKIFRGQKTLTDKAYKGLRWLSTTALTNALYLWDQKILHDWRRAILVAVGVGFISTLGSGTPLAGAALGLASGFGWAFLGKSIETVIAKIEQRKFTARQQQDYDKAAFSPDKNLITHYLKKDTQNEYLPDEQNLKRYRPKLDNSKKENLRLLNYVESDMNYDDAEPSQPQSMLRDFERLSSAYYRYYGAQYDATLSEEGILYSIFPNGLTMLAKVDPETRFTTHYVTYNQNFDSFEKGNNKKHLDPALTKLPCESKIHKFTHAKGRDFKYTPLADEELFEDLVENCGEDILSYEAFGLKLSEIFNSPIPEKVEPKNKTPLKVEHWLHEINIKPPQ